LRRLLAATAGLPARRAVAVSSAAPPAAAALRAVADLVAAGLSASSCAACDCRVMRDAAVGVSGGGAVVSASSASRLRRLLLCHDSRCRQLLQMSFKHTCMSTGYG